MQLDEDRLRLGTALEGAAGTASGDELARLVAENKALKAQVGRLEGRLSAVLSHAPVILFTLDPEGRFTGGGGRALAPLGLVPGMFDGLSILDVYRHMPTVLEHARRALAGETFTVQAEHSAATSPGSTSRADAPTLTYETRYSQLRDELGKVVELVGVAVDITDRKNAERALARSESQLIEADRLASLGTLAAGVAHEINNPLSYVLLNLDLALRQAAQLGEAGPLTSRLKEARAGVERVRVIVQDLKAFSRADNERRGPVDVRAVLESTIDIADGEIRHRAYLTREYGQVPPVAGDTARLEQVFLNLLVNAAQSMPEGEAAKNSIKVSTSLDPSGRVAVEIADTGSGMSPEIQSRIFDPFFSTKPAGVGTGLGLSICHGIVASMGGEITVKSELGKGSVFRVLLPVAASASTAEGGGPPSSVDPRSDGPKSSSPGGAPPPRRGRVLIVDDEPALAAALGRSLEDQYDIVTLSNGKAALERLRDGEEFDAILCDLIMPQVTGMDLHAALMRDRPAVAERIIFMTGGTFTARARDFLANVPNPTLEKPFELKVLSTLLRARLQIR